MLRIDGASGPAYCTRPVQASDALFLAGGGLVAGVVNTLAGGGSLLTVPLLTFLGLPGSVANGTNRVGVLLQSGVASWGFWREGVSGVRSALPLLLPVAAGALLGAFGGAFQAGVGILLLYALSAGGSDLVRSNAVKVVLNFCFSLLVLPVFVSARQVALPEALALGAGFAAGGLAGPRIAVRGGERVIRPVLACAVVALAGRMLGLY